MNKTPKVYTEEGNNFKVRNTIKFKPINLERLDKWVIKDHTKPRDLVFTLPTELITINIDNLSFLNNEDLNS